ncbi:uncharacterized protein BBA_09484 [Beauveria bassiana ARSEF 2860]|uniref:Cell wall protein n=1 Tax=Beauveria bassiana (strain ARSEF 2860) TaxID=655819 RepID=J4KL47_BEAB2|nr:uncharacterized protein BBA_09484 [Beauveria bassiana ARSEF 2860]EJP61574.1 hypothetical protein BBA_09484 [Beauveria bassiana ARSEF 2860]
MRFSLPVFVALVGVAVAVPTLPVTGSPVTGLLGSNDLVGELTGVVDQVEAGLGVQDLEERLDALLGSSLLKVESAIGQPLAQKLLALVQGGLSPQIVHAVAQGIALVEQGVAIQTVDAYVKGMTDGAVTSLDKALGMDNIQKVLQI